MELHKMLIILLLSSIIFLETFILLYVLKVYSFVLITTNSLQLYADLFFFTYFQSEIDKLNLLWTSMSMFLYGKMMLLLLFGLRARSRLLVSNVYSCFTF